LYPAKILKGGLFCFQKQTRETTFAVSLVFGCLTGAV
jgi:hypothetical protein